MSNHITATGNLTKDPELTFSSNGNARVNLTMACNYTYKSKANETVTTTTFFKVTLWDQTAENAAESLKKGDRLTVSGRIQERTWVDETQTRQRSFEIVASEVAASVKFRSLTVERPIRQVAPVEVTHEVDSENEHPNEIDSDLTTREPSEFMPGLELHENTPLAA